MAKASAGPKFSRRDERDLLRSASDALPLDFPNPERIGCPEARTLEAVAARHLEIANIDDVVDHIATCSPCYAIYTLYRKKYCSRKNRNRSITAAVVFGALIGTWFLAHPIQPGRKTSTTPMSQVAPSIAVLDFRNRTFERSDKPQTTGSITTPHLPPSLLSLKILLPLGTEDGQYSLQFRDAAGGIEAQTTGAARWDGAKETLAARIDLRAVKPGLYTLAVRKGTSSWREYSVFLD